MQVNLFKFLISFFVLRKCQAVMTWRPVNCDGYIFKDKSMDEIWDNAIEMTKNAQSQIGIIPTSPLGMMTTNSRRIGANAKFMYGITFNPIFGTDSAGLAMMNAVKNTFADIQRGLEGTLGGTFDINNALFFCEGRELQYGVIEGIANLGEVWYAEITNNGVTEYIILRYASGSNTPPCKEPNGYQAKTFSAVQTVDQGTGLLDTTFTGIILCSNQVVQVLGKGTIDVNATLDMGFDPMTKDPDPDRFISLAGILVHEIAHVVGRSLGTTWEDRAGAFGQCVNLSNENPAGALINPDNYRLFAEMSMSPATKWKAPKPAQASNSTSASMNTGMSTSMSSGPMK